MGALDVWYVAAFRFARGLKMPLSVLMFCSQFRPLVGGAERQAEKLAKALVKYGINIKILTPKINSESPTFENDYGFQVHRFPLLDICKSFPNIRGLGPLNLISIRLQIKKIIARHLKDIDIVHTHIASPLSAFVMQVARDKNIPVLCKMASAGEHNDLIKLSQGGIGGSCMLHSMLKGISKWIAISEAVRQSLIAYKVQKKKIVKIPNGVDLMDTQTFKYKRNFARRFLYLGRLSKTCQRDIPTLIRSFDRLAEQLPDVELALVGGGDQHAEIVEFAHQMRHRTRIQFPGIQAPLPWLQWADCLIVPSKREGLSNALLEAMAAGLACIANDIPPNREALADGAAGMLVPGGSEKHLTEAMLKMATLNGYSASYGQKAFLQVKENYSIDSIANRYIRLYEKLKFNSNNSHRQSTI
jgi:glycosyltransferase involved in cell wall biosynthesis